MRCREEEAGRRLLTIAARRILIPPRTIANLVSMSITVLFFARLREQVGKSGATVPATGSDSVADVWARAVGAPMPGNTLAAVNHEHANTDHPVRDGDEVAFFPPITGG